MPCDGDGDERHDGRVGLSVDVLVRDDFKALADHAVKRLRRMDEFKANSIASRSMPRRMAFCTAVRPLRVAARFAGLIAAVANSAVNPAALGVDELVRAGRRAVRSSDTITKFSA